MYFCGSFASWSSTALSDRSSALVSVCPHTAYKSPPPQPPPPPLDSVSVRVVYSQISAAVIVVRSPGVARELIGWSIRASSTERLVRTAEATAAALRFSFPILSAIAWSDSSVAGFIVVPAAFLRPRILEMMGGIKVVFIGFLLSNYIVFSQNRKS